MRCAKDVANFYIDLSNKDKFDDGITNMRINKLLYFAQGHYLLRTGFPLFDEDFYAWDFGPVIPKIYQKYSHLQNSRITFTDKSYDFKLFDTVELNVLIDVSMEYGKYSTSELVKMTHADISPWRAAYDSKSQKISKDEIKNHFNLVGEIPTIDDILKFIPVYDKVNENNILLLSADEYCPEDDDYAELLNAV